MNAPESIPVEKPPPVAAAFCCGDCAYRQYSPVPGFLACEVRQATPFDRARYRSPFKPACPLWQAADE
ncbi:MAG: hypothetical protein NT159_07845 [Proteobacteria bacterium]|nr:hypothetical protein [Pseudomonadota bacterium]